MSADDEYLPLWSRRLTERRVDRDFSYAEVAHHLRLLSREREGSDCGVTARTVWRWEHGTRPLARYRRLLRVLYDMSSEQLGFKATTRADDPPVEVAQRPAEHAVNSQMVLASRSTASGRTGVEAVIYAFRNADRQVGGGYVYGAVIGYLTREVTPRVLTTTPGAYAAAAALTEMAGWMAHDAGRDGLAQRHFDRALRLASLTDDVELRAHVHASMSHLAQHADRFHEALRLAEVGASMIKKEHGPAIAARLHAMEARALAALGQGSDCGRKLLSAERMLDLRPLRPPSPWVSPFDHASLAAEASECMEQLRHLAAARRHSEHVIRLRDASHVRSRAFGQLRLANILVTAGEIDHACAVAANALAGCGQLASHRVSQLLRSLHAKLTPHTTAHGVGAAVDALSAALDARVPAHLLIAGGHDAER